MKFTLLGVTGVAACVLGCGGKSFPATPSPSDAGADDDGAILLPYDAGDPTDDAQVDAASDASIQTHGLGLVNLANSSAGNSAIIDGLFEDSVKSGCHVPTPLNTCVIHECPYMTMVFGRNAGTLTVSSPRIFAVMQPDTQGAPFGTHYFLDGDGFSQGDELTISTTGNEVPAFKGTLVFPRDLALVPPNAADNLTIKPNVDVTLHWTGAASDPVLVQFDLPTFGANTLLMDCLFDGAAGQGLIPAATLADYKATAATFDRSHLITLRVTTQRWGIAVVGGWRVQLRATGTGVSTQALFL